jgi:hypothetical protein
MAATTRKWHAMPGAILKESEDFMRLHRKHWMLIVALALFALLLFAPHTGLANDVRQVINWGLASAAQLIDKIGQ